MPSGGYGADPARARWRSASGPGICDELPAPPICHIAGKNLFYARLPDVKGTAGTAAIMSDEVLRARPAYEWTLNHVIEVKDERELFRTRFETIRP